MALACLLVATTAFVLVVVLLAPRNNSAKTAVTGSTGRANHSRSTAVHIQVSPRVVVRGQTATIVVTGIEGSSPEVQLVGATSNLGQAFAWTPLRRGVGGWRAALPAPEFRGVYRIRLRSDPAARVLASDGWLLRVFARGTLARPLLETPEAVARSWVRSQSASAMLVGIRRWPLPAFDHRDPRLHQLLVIAYTLEQQRAVPEPVGVFVTAVRDSAAGRWRLLETTVVPQ